MKRDHCWQIITDQNISFGFHILRKFHDSAPLTLVSKTKLGVTSHFSEINAGSIFKNSAIHCFLFYFCSKMIFITFTTCDTEYITTTTTTTTTIYLYPRMMGKLQFTFYISRGYSLPKITIGAKKNGQTLCY